MTGLNDGDIALVRAEGLLGRFIKYRHAALVWHYQSQYDPIWWGCQRLTVEANPHTGVKVWKFPHWGVGGIIVRPTGAAPCQGQAAIASALQRLGERYDYAGAFRAFLRWLRGGKIHVMAVVCTDLVVASWAEAGNNPVPGIAHPLPDEIADGGVEIVGAF
jgi:hypothetical protein